MTPVATRTAPAPSVIAGNARTVLGLSLLLWDGMRAPGQRKGRRAIGKAIRDLDRALDEYRLLDGEVITWERIYPELSVTADPHGEALEKAAAEAQDGARMLIAAVAVCFSADVAGLMHELMKGEDQ